MKILYLVLLLFFYTIALVRDAATGESLWKQELERRSETIGTSSQISQLFVRKLLEARVPNEINIAKSTGHSDEADDDDTTEMETELMLPDETDEESVKVEDGKGKEQKEKEQQVSETEEDTHEDTKAKEQKKKPEEEELKKKPLIKSKQTSSSERSSKSTKGDGNEALKGEKPSGEQQQRAMTVDEKLKKKTKRAKEDTILDTELGEDVDESAKSSNASEQKLLKSEIKEEPKLKHETEVTLRKDTNVKKNGKKESIGQKDSELVVGTSKQPKKATTPIKRTTQKTQLEEFGGVEKLEEAASGQEEGSRDGTLAKKLKKKEAKKAPLSDLDVADEELSSDVKASKQGEDKTQPKLQKKGEKKKDDKKVKQKDMQGKSMKEKKKEEKLKVEEVEDIEEEETKEVNLASNVEASPKKGGKKPLNRVAEEENEDLDDEEEVQSKSEEDFDAKSEIGASLSKTAGAKSKKETPAQKVKKEKKPVVLQEGSEEDPDDTLPEVESTQKVNQVGKTVKNIAKKGSHLNMESKELADKKSKKAGKRGSASDVEIKEVTDKESKVSEGDLSQEKELVKSFKGEDEDGGLDSKLDSEEKLEDKESGKPGSKETQVVDATTSSSAQVIDDDNDDDNYEYGDFIKGFNELPSKFQDTAQKVVDHLGPNIQKITDTSKNYFNKANQQISESFTPLVGKQFAPLFASLISYGLLIVPLAVVIVLFEHIRALLSLQKVMLFVNVYLAAYFVTLLLATFIIGEPMNFFFRSSPSGYIHLQLLQALGYIIYLILQTFDLVTCCASEALLIKFTTTLQWLLAFGIGLHYYITVFHRAMGMKGPHTSWKIYGIYSIAFCVLCLFVRLKRTKKEYTQLGDADTNKKN